jgi:hypothetical protein
MNLPLVALLVLFGLAMGLGTLAGVIPTGLELPLWLVIAVICGVWIGMKVTRLTFLHGLLAGLLAFLVSPLLQVAFFDTYLRNNPLAAQSLKSVPPGMSPRLFVAIISPVIAIVYGLCVGLLAWLAAKLMRRGKPA